MHQYIYLIEEIQEQNLPTIILKLGQSNNPKKRLSVLRSGNRKPLKIFRQFPNKNNVSDYIFKNIFQNFRNTYYPSSEWYEFPRNRLIEIIQIIESYTDGRQQRQEQRPENRQEQPENSNVRLRTSNIPDSIKYICNTYNKFFDDKRMFRYISQRVFLKNTRSQTPYNTINKTLQDLRISGFLYRRRIGKKYYYKKR